MSHRDNSGVELLTLLRSEGLLDVLVRRKDDFTFYQQDACNIVVDDSDDNGFPAVDSDNVEVYHPGDVAGPEYHRRFEDYTSSNIDKFLQHVLRNIESNNDGIKAFTEENQACDTILDPERDEDSDDDKCDESEILSEQLSVTNSIRYNISPQVKEQLAYCLYRLNRLSASLGVNIFSMLIAHKLSMRKSRHGDQATPERLIEFNVQAADRNGNCCGVVTDKYGGLTLARDLIYKDLYGQTPSRKVLGYIGDYDRLVELMDKLGINPANEHPEEYTLDFIRKIANGIMVDNYTYITRANGGYYKGVYNMLKTMSLDTVQNQSTKIKLDPIEEIVNVVLNYSKTPTPIYDALLRKFRGDPLEVMSKVIASVASASEDVISHPLWPSGVKVDSNGFLLDQDDQPFYVKFARRDPCRPDVGMKQRWEKFTNGFAYFNVNGYVMFQPFIYSTTGKCRKAVLVFELEPFLYQLSIDGNEVNEYLLGDEISEDS